MRAETESPMKIASRPVTFRNSRKTRPMAAKTLIRATISFMSAPNIDAPRARRDCGQHFMRDRAGGLSDLVDGDRFAQELGFRAYPKRRGRNIRHIEHS